MKDKLKAVYDLRKRLDVLTMTRQELYNTVHSPSFFEKSNNHAPSDPTAKAVYRISQLDEKIKPIAKKYSRTAVEILDWLYQIDPEEMLNISQFRSIIICHYLRGLSWRVTARRVMKSNCEDAPKASVKRYFMNHPEG